MLSRLKSKINKKVQNAKKPKKHSQHLISLFTPVWLSFLWKILFQGFFKLDNITCKKMVIIISEEKNGTQLVLAATGLEPATFRLQNYGAGVVVWSARAPKSSSSARLTAAVVSHLKRRDLPTSIEPVRHTGYLSLISWLLQINSWLLQINNRLLQINSWLL